MLVGVEDLKIGKGGDAVFLTTAQTALIERGEKVKGQYDLISTELMKNWDTLFVEREWNVGFV